VSPLLGKKNDGWIIVTLPLLPSDANVLFFSCPLNTDFSVVHVIVVLVIVSFALLYLFISVYFFTAPLFWDKNNALPLNHPFGTEFAQLVVKITLLSVLFVILPSPFPF